MSNTALVCPNCDSDVSQIEVFCDYCGYPLAGTERKKQFLLENKSQTSLLLEMPKIHNTG